MNQGPQQVRIVSQLCCVRCCGVFRTCWCNFITKHIVFSFATHWWPCGARATNCRRRGRTTSTGMHLQVRKNFHSLVVVSCPCGFVCPLVSNQALHTCQYMIGVKFWTCAEPYAHVPTRLNVLETFGGGDGPDCVRNIIVFGMVTNNNTE